MRRRRFKRSVFDDRRSLLHAALGFMCPLLPPWAAIVATAVFTAYEVLEEKKWRHDCAAYDITEFLVGFVMGLMAVRTVAG